LTVQLPGALLDSLAGIEGFDKEAFDRVHTSGDTITSIRLNPLKGSVLNRDWPVMQLHDASKDEIYLSQAIVESRIPWSQSGYYLSQRPSFTFDPLFHAGCYYVQEASSMFLEQAIKQTVDLSRPLRVLDLCAAPGGKSTHIQSLISKDSLLVSNEVIKTRMHILKDNCIKWGADNVVVTSNDPKDFARLPGYFDMIVIDAPCSGSGLFRRDKSAVDEWSINNVALCSQRQQRILADAWPSLKEGGILIYSTCSYSKQEDEEIMDWMNEELQIENIRISIDREWGIVETVSDKYHSYGYRFWPFNLNGEGFFLSCVRKIGTEKKFSFRPKNKPEPVNKKDLPLVHKWISDSGHFFIQKNSIVYGIPGANIDDITMLLATLRVLYSGIIVGEIFHRDLVPAHSLAMTRFVNNTVPYMDLQYESAIDYLKRKEFNLQSKELGWIRVSYKGYNLGWVKVLTNRINNYYPRELRILKDL